MRDNQLLYLLIATSASLSLTVFFVLTRSESSHHPKSERYHHQTLSERHHHQTLSERQTPKSSSAGRFKLLTAFSQSYEARLSVKTCTRVEAPKFENDNFPDAKESDVKESDASWISLSDSVHLYSSYIDNRIIERGVRVSNIRTLTVIKDAKKALKFACLIWLHKTADPILSPVDATELWLPFWPKGGASVESFSSYILSCPIPRMIKRDIVMGVSIIEGVNCVNSTQNYRKLQQIENFQSFKTPTEPTPRLASQKKDFIVCVKALDYDSKDGAGMGRKLIEWIEMQFILGVDTIMIHVYEVTPEIDSVLKYYTKKLGPEKLRAKKLGVKKSDSAKSVIVKKILPLPRSLGVPPNQDARKRFFKSNLWLKRKLELIPYNDCYYRHLYTHKFAIMLDIDEVIVPVKGRQLQDVIHFINASDAHAFNTYSSFSVSNVYFFDNFIDKNLLNETLTIGAPTSKNQLIHGDAKSYLVSHNIRSANFSAPGNAVKSIFPLASSLAVFNHFTLFPIQEDMKRNVIISKSLAQMNHYRNRCSDTMSSDCIDNFLRYRKVDTIMYKYENELIDRLNRVLVEIK